MGFQVSDKHIEEYYMSGYTVFRKILPPSLIRDLRQVSDRAKAIAREQSGPQVQRLQPVANYDLDQQPFIDYANLPPLVDAIAKVLTPRHRHGDRDHFGILFEPADMPYCTPWHRDWRDNAIGLPLSMWDEVFNDINHFNQINCALYEDSSTWFVLGSHLRRDLPAEIERFPDRPIPGVDLDGRSAEEREPLCLEYCRSMPGAVQLHLEAGDFAPLPKYTLASRQLCALSQAGRRYTTVLGPLNLRRGTRKHEPNRANGVKLASVWKIQISTLPIERK